MAVKKATKNAESKVEIKDEVVKETETKETVTAEESAPTGEDSGTIVVDDKKEEPTVSVQKTEEVPTKKCKANRVKMRVDHTCFIGGEWYYLKAGVCYNVDDNVKSILDGAGLLAPL